MISFTQKGDFAKTFQFLNSSKKININSILSKYGEMGVSALSRNTPMDSGKTANSWYYKITEKNNKTTITWYNKNVVNGVNIAIILQYGHGTKNGGYVSGRDYINPALKTIFDNMADEVWKEVTRK